MLARIENILGIYPHFLEVDEIEIQNELASLLRAQAIQHLAEEKGVVAESFRGEYLATGQGDYQSFLNRQKRNGEWGTYIEATAIAEKLGFTLVVTPVKNGESQGEICLYRAENNDAPVVHLYNSNNTHWYVNANTKGDGNCLFNAIAQGLQKTVCHEAGKPVPPIAAAPKRNVVFSPPEKQVVASQEAILASVQKAAKPSEVEGNLKAEKERISRLSPEEQKQIEDDHALALRLAYEEMGYAVGHLKQSDLESSVKPPRP